MGTGHTVHLEKAAYEGVREAAYETRRTKQEIVNEAVYNWLAAYRRNGGNPDADQDRMD